MERLITEKKIERFEELLSAIPQGEETTRPERPGDEELLKLIKEYFDLLGPYNCWERTVQILHYNAELIVKGSNGRTSAKYVITQLYCK